MTSSKKPSRIELLEREIERLEAKFRESTEELKALRLNFKAAARAELQAEIEEIKDEWEDLHYRWWVIVLAGVLTFFVLSYFYYTQLGWHADQRALPLSSDWLLARLPTVNLVPVLSWGWLALHLYAAAVAILYYPRQMPFLLFTLGLFMFIRTTFIFLSPIGPPQGMLDLGKIDYIFSRIMGIYTFKNEFVFSGHTSVPFLFCLFFETRLQKLTFLIGSLVMATCVLLTHNHYTVDVLGAYFITYSIFVLSRTLYFQFVRPLFLLRPEP